MPNSNSLWKTFKKQDCTCANHFPAHGTSAKSFWLTWRRSLCQTPQQCLQRSNQVKVDVLLTSTYIFNIHRQVVLIKVFILHQYQYAFVRSWNNRDVIHTWSFLALLKASVSTSGQRRTAQGLPAARGRRAAALPRLWDTVAASEGCDFLRYL